MPHAAQMGYNDFFRKQERQFHLRLGTAAKWESSGR